MTARQVIMELYNTGELRKSCLSIGGKEWADDLQQEVMLVLMEKPAEKIMQAYNAGYFKFYVVRIIMTFFNSKTSTFYTKYRHLDKTPEINFDIVDDSVLKDDSKYIALEKAIQKLSTGKDFPYEQKLLELHQSLKTKKKVSRETGIPYRTVCHNIDVIYKKLRHDIDNN